MTPVSFWRLQRNTHLMLPPSLSPTKSLKTWVPSLFYPSLIRGPQAGDVRLLFKMGETTVHLPKSRGGLSVLGKISSQARLGHFV